MADWLLTAGGLILLAALVMAGLAALGLGAATMPGSALRTHRLLARGAKTTGEAESVTARWALAADRRRIFFTVVYRYTVRGTDYRGTLASDTASLGAPGVARILESERVAGRDHPIAVEFENGVRVSGRRELETHLLDRFKTRHPSLHVVFNPNYPVMSMVDPRSLR